MNDGGDCRTAPATPGLLNRRKRGIFTLVIDARMLGVQPECRVRDSTQLYTTLAADTR